VLHSHVAADSAAWIVRLAKRARRATPTTRTEGPRRAPRHPSAQAEMMLSVVPGISTTMARSLLGAFGSVASVAAAAPDDLRRHPGIGRVRAARTTAALRGAYVAAADREPGTASPVGAVRPVGRWILTGPEGSSEPRSFDRRAIALRALRSAAPGTELVDGLTGEVLTAGAGSSQAV
jgi:DNA excision repair protein ERCC-4